MTQDTDPAQKLTVSPLSVLALSPLSLSFLDTVSLSPTSPCWASMCVSGLPWMQFFFIWGVAKELPISNLSSAFLPEYS